MAKILVLGATSPIARSLALRFARRGDTIFAAARDGWEAARVAEDITVRSGTTAMSGTFEAGDFASHPGFVERVREKMGGLDGAILAFGVLGEEPLAHEHPAAALSLVEQNFSGAASLLTIVAELFEAQASGFIIVLGSVAGDRGRARNYVYGSAKGALALFAQGLRGRLSRAGVRVMTVKLGPVDTRMTWGREGTLFKIAPDRAADRIYAGFQRGAEVIYVPWYWRPIMSLIGALPERVFKRLNF